MITDALWLTFTEHENPRDKWDASWVAREFDRNGIRQWLDAPTSSPTEICIVFPAGIHVDRVTQLNEYLAAYKRVVLVLTADEQGLFPVNQIMHDDCIVWQQTPNPATRLQPSPILTHFPQQARFFGYCVPERFQRPTDLGARDLVWSFAGQVTHKRRHDAARAMKALNEPGILMETAGFAQGVDASRYYRLLTRTKFVVCPAGVANPDTFRMHEALACRAIPIVDACNPDGSSAQDYWDLVYPDCPLPKVSNWDALQAYIETLLVDYDYNRSRCSAWYADHMRRQSKQLTADLAG